MCVKNYHFVTCIWFDWIMSVTLALLSCTIILKNDGYGTISRQLRQAFDLVAGLVPAHVFEFYNYYFNDGKQSQIPHRVWIEFYQEDAVERCKLIVDGTFVVYDGAINSLLFGERQIRFRKESCVSCRRKCGFYKPLAEDVLTSYNSRIVISVCNRSRLCTNLKTELAETLELMNRIIATPGHADVLKTKEIQQVVVIKTLTDLGKAAIVKIDGDYYYKGPQDNSVVERGWSESPNCIWCTYFNAYTD